MTMMMTSTMQAITEANELLAFHAALILRVKNEQQNHRRQLHGLSTPPTELLRLPLLPSPTASPGLYDIEDDSYIGDDDDGYDSEEEIEEREIRQDLPPAKKARAARYMNYVPEEETIRNDYSQRYVDGGEWPQNWVLGAEPERRFEEYPKQQRLLTLKKASVNQYALPPSYVFFSQLNTLHQSKFDVILIDPPFSSSFTWNHLQELPIPSLASDPSFVFLWVGSGAGEGLERGREVLAKWGYRRCEDVVWVKTNKTTNRGPGTDPPTTSLLTRTKQHCLMGIRGTVRRSSDSWFVHCNVDTDVIIWEGDPLDPTRKPPEMYSLIENFCLGTRRLEVFGKLSSLRRGWVTALSPGQEEYLPDSGAVHVEGEEGGVAGRWNQEMWDEGIKELVGIGNKVVVPVTPEIDALRPKSPVRPGQGGNNNNNSNNMGSNPTTIATPMRFSGGGRGGGGGGGGRDGDRFGNGNGMNMQNPIMHGQNQLMAQPMVGMNNSHSHTPQQMGMGMGMGNSMEDMMGVAGWNSMIGGMGIGGLGVGVGGLNGIGGMNNSMNGMNTRAMGMSNGAGGLNGMAGVNGMQGMGNNNMMGNGVLGNTGLGALPLHMMGQMGMGNTFPMQGVGVGNSAGVGGMPMFNGALNGWADHSQFGMDGAGWDGGMGTGIPGMVGGMNMGNIGNLGMGNMNGAMGNMGMGGMGMNHGQQWGGSGTF